MYSTVRFLTELALLVITTNRDHHRNNEGYERVNNTVNQSPSEYNYNKSDSR